jgi:hypothetical protein
MNDPQLAMEGNAQVHGRGNSWSHEQVSCTATSLSRSQRAKTLFPSSYLLHPRKRNVQNQTCPHLEVSEVVSKCRFSLL